MTREEFNSLLNEKELISIKLMNAREEIIAEQSKGFEIGDKVRVITRENERTLDGFITGWEVCDKFADAYPTLHAVKKDGTEANKNVSVCFLDWYGVSKIEKI